MNEVKEQITIQAVVKASIEKVWKFWSEAEHIKNWCSASDDWHVPKAENDLKVGGKFSTTMAAKDGSFSFDFEGNYTKVIPNEEIHYTIADGRKVSIIFKTQGDSVSITETFDPESENPIEVQKGGWQAILDNFKSYTENN